MQADSKQETPASDAALPLAGVRVLDLTRVFAGPQCTMVLADLGADVIKVEHHLRGDDTRDWGIKVGATNTTYFDSMNRNKRSLTLNLDTEAGRGLLGRLIENSDVLVHNFKQGDDTKFGIDADTIRQKHPSLVYCAIRGYPSHSSERDRPGYDLVVQAESGLMSLNGGSGQPPMKIVVALVDQVTGMSAAHSILAALYQRRATGRGAILEQALSDTGTMVVGAYSLDALHLGRDPEKYGNGHASIVPYGVFAAADGNLIIAAGNNGLYRRLCVEVLEHPELWDEPEYQTNLGRLRHRDRLIGQLHDVLTQWPRAELLKRLKAVGIPCGEVAGPYEAATSARVRESGMIVHMTDAQGQPATVLAPPYLVDGARLPVRLVPPKLGEHSVACVRDRLGLGEDEVRALVESGALVVPN